MSDLELLTMKIGNQTVQEMTGIGFLSWLSNKLNGVKTFDATASELIGMVKNPVLGRLADETKLDILRKLQKLNIQIP